MATDPPQSRRVKAARALAGYASTADLAKALARPGLSDKTLRKIESGARTAEVHELAAIADACHLPYSFFVIDFAQLVGLERRESTEGRPDFVTSDPEEANRMVAEIKRTFEATARELQELVDSHQRELRELMQESPAGAAAASPPGELGRRAQDSEPTPERQPRELHPAAEDRPRGNG